MIGQDAPVIEGHVRIPQGKPSPRVGDGLAGDIQTHFAIHDRTEDRCAIDRAYGDEIRAVGCVITARQANRPAMVKR